MTHLDQRSLGRVAPERLDMSLDAGLRQFMVGVYNKVALGLVLSAGLAYLTSMVPPVRDAMFRTSADGRFAGHTLIGMIVAFAPLMVLLGSMFAMWTPSARGEGATCDLRTRASKGPFELWGPRATAPLQTRYQWPT